MLDLRGWVRSMTVDACGCEALATVCGRQRRRGPEGDPKGAGEMRCVGESSVHRRRTHELPVGDLPRRSTERRPSLEPAERHAGGGLERAHRLCAPEPQPCG